ncbi:MAG: PIG-L family deacetylase [Actinobacteria bacterium]|nr:PIG-L family deacetylase [Actinomycetota bacterium]
MPKDFPGRSVVVVSPHSDDGVLSLGAAMASWARLGAHVELLTVFALDPSSDASAGGWDTRGGFRTEGEAAAGRRAEDAAACAILGATPRWLPFGSVDYERHGDQAAVRDAIAAAADGVDALLLPGFPLNHPDHEWLGRALVGSRMGCRRLGLYVEQPYGRRTDGVRRLPPWAEEALGAPPVFGSVSAGVRDRVAKWRAVREYRTQLALLGMTRSLRRGPHSLVLGELVAWIDP